MATTPTTPTTPPPEDDVDDDTLSAFDRVVKKYAEKNPEWLKTLTPSLPSSLPASAPTEDLAGYFRKRTETLEEMIEELRGMLTPEQWTLLKSQRDAAKALVKGSGGQTHGAQPITHATPAVPAKKARTWL